MAGFITERHMAEAEEAFPGITRFFESLREKPRTFLDLVRMFETASDAREAGRS
jgi:hypothetical protein